MCWNEFGNMNTTVIDMNKDRATCSNNVAEDPKDHLGKDHVDSLLENDKCSSLDYNGKDLKFRKVEERSTEEQLRCLECDYAANDSSSLYMHIRGHTDDRPFKCQYCPYATQTENNLTVHTKSHILDAPNSFQIQTVEPPAENLLISESNISKYALRRPKIVLTEDLKENGEASISNQVANPEVEKLLQKDVRTATSGAKKFKCSYVGCSYSTNATISFKNHLDIHSNKRAFKCQICLKSFRRADHCLSHERLHVKKISYKCEHGAGCTKCKKLSIDFLFRCLWCPFTCERESQLVIHCRSPHKFKRSHGATFDENVDKPPPALEYQIKREDYHEIVERNGDDHLQDVEFIFTDNFVEFSNQNETPVISAELFVQPSSVGSETGDLSPYGATEVSSFTTVSTTNCNETPANPKAKVSSSNSTSRKFKCNRPGCTFSSSYSKNLILHRLLAHSGKDGKKPFQCKQCSKRFVRSRGLKNHERTHIHGFEHRCKECDYGTQYKCNLKTHMSMKHGKIMTNEDSVSFRRKKTKV